MSSESLSNFLDNLKDIIVVEDGKQKTIKLCNMIEKAKLYDPERFNIIYNRFLHEKIDSDDLLTEKANNIQVMKAMNVLYLDIDYKVEFDIDCDEDQIYIAKLYFETFIKVNMINDYALFVLIPENVVEVDNMYKCGAHIFIYLSRNVSKNERTNMYNATKAKIMNDDNIKNAIQEIINVELTDSVYDVLFDKAPLISCQSLILFAEKRDALRHYKLIKELCVYENDVQINGVLNTVQEEETIDIDDEFELDLDDFTPDDVEQSIKSKTALETFNFLRSLITLCPEHKFWDRLSHHDVRCKKVIKPLIYWLNLAEFVENGINVSKSFKCVQYKLAEVLVPLLNFTVNDGDESKRNNFNVCYKTIKSYVNSMYQNEFSKYNILKNGELGGYQYVIRKAFKDSDKFRLLKGYLKKIYPEMDKQELEKEVNNKLSKLKVIEDIGPRIFSGYSKFVKFIMKNMTTEITPFITIPKIMKPGTVIHDETLFQDKLFINHDKKYKLYHNTIKTYLRMFIAIMYYNTKDTTESIRASLTSLTSRYVYILKNGSETIIKTYNICQTEDYIPFPRNQWIEDSDKNLVVSWFMYLYKTYILAELETDKKLNFIDEFVNIIRQCNVIQNVKPEQVLNPLTNFKKSIDKISDNVLYETMVNVDITKPIRKDSCEESPYFSMWNGILEFVLDDKKYAFKGLKRGDINFHKHNYNIFMDTYSCVHFTNPSEYNFNNWKYLRIKTMIEQIYTDPELRDFVCMNVAQTLHSVGLRDQFHQYYGSGSEGKSLFNDSICAMLGCGKNIIISTKDCETPIMRNPYGYAMTVVAEKLIQTNNSNHDSGGIVEMVNKRFATIQEPNTKMFGGNINVSTIKQLTSNSQIAPRKAYGRNPTLFKPKLYITLQTNTVMGYSEENDAVLRRVAVIPHSSKFYTEAMKDMLTKSNNVYKADPTLGSDIQSDPEYWEALFQYLLPYAQRFIREGYRGLSDIPKPKCVMNLTEFSFSRSSGISGWLNLYFKLRTHKCISVKNFIDTIVEMNTQLKQNRLPQIDRMFSNNSSETDINQKIAEIVNGKFANIYLFKLKDEFIDPETKLPKDGVVKINDKDIDINFPLREYDEELMNYLFEEHPVGNINTQDYDIRTIYIIDHDFDFEN